MSPVSNYLPLTVGRSPGRLLGESEREISGDYFFEGLEGDHLIIRLHLIMIRGI